MIVGDLDLDRAEDDPIYLADIGAFLMLCHEATDSPVFCIQECGVLTAMAQGDRFCVISTYGQRSVFFTGP